MVEVNVDKFYSNRALYPFIPEAVFDALEAAYLSGNECAMSLIHISEPTRPY